MLGPVLILISVSSMLAAVSAACAPQAPVLGTAMAGSANSGMVSDGHGGVVKRLSFEDLLPHHVLYVIMTIMEWDHLWKCRSESRKDYVRSLRPGAAPPCRATCIKITHVVNMAFGVYP